MEITSKGPAFRGRMNERGYASLTVEAAKDNSSILMLIETTTGDNKEPLTVGIALTECQVVWLQDELSKYDWSTTVRKNV
jgi:hypothetical protein